MPRKQAFMLATALAFGAGLAIGQVQAPTETKGFNAEELQSLDLSGELDSVAGRSLRMRKITLQPGGVVALHTHKDRPTNNYVLQGSVTFHPEGAPEKVVRPGDGFAEGRATTHWAENRGTVPAVWIAVDIPRS